MTHCRKPLAITLKPARSSARDTAASWVTTSAQSRPSSIIAITPRICPSARRNRDAASRPGADRRGADGRWDAAYAGAKSATVPEDLAAALAANPAAHAFFGTLDSRNRYSILYRVQDAKKSETRARRVAQYVEMLAEGRKIYP